MERRVIHTGVSDLAEEVGASPSTVSKQLRRGLTEDQIRQKYKARRAQGQGPGPSALGRRALSKSAKAYLQTESATSSKTQAAGAKTLEPRAHGDGNGNVQLTIKDQLQAEIRKEVALADKREWEMAEKRKTTMPITIVDRWFGGYVIKSTDFWSRMPGEVCERLAAIYGPAVDPIIVMEVLEKIVERGLRLLADHGGEVEQTKQKDDDGDQRLAG